jgi:hypothetical protein
MLQLACMKLEALMKGNFAGCFCLYRGRDGAECAAAQADHHMAAL